MGHWKGAPISFIPSGKAEDGAKFSNANFLLLPFVHVLARASVHVRSFAYALKPRREARAQGKARRQNFDFINTAKLPVARIRLAT